MRLAVQGPGVLGPHRAKRQPTLSRIRWTERPCLGRPDARIRLTGTGPRCAMSRAQPDAAAAVSTSDHSADAQIPAAIQHRTGVSEEHRDRRPVTVAPPLTVARAQPVPRYRTVTLSHRAPPTTQYRVIWIDKIDLDAKLGSHHGDHLLEQPAAHTRPARDQCGHQRRSEARRVGN